MRDQRRVENRYGLVPVTNTRDFVLVGEDAQGRPAKLETFRLAESAEEFQLRLEKPGAFARVCAGRCRSAQRSPSRETCHGCSHRRQPRRTRPRRPRRRAGEAGRAAARLRLQNHARPLRGRPGRPFPPESRRGADGRLRARLRDHLSWRLGGSASDRKAGADSATSGPRIRRLIRSRRCASLQGRWSQACRAWRWDLLQCR